MPMAFNARIPARTFGLRSDKTVLGFSGQSQKTLARQVSVDPNHVFDPLVFEQIRLWWEAEDTRAPLYLSGPTGCGKTSTILQFLARVRAPVVSITCRPRMDKNDLLGQWGVESRTGKFCWYDGPAAIAWRQGTVLLINEFTTAPASAWVSANDILEGDDLTNTRTGECIRRHANTRVVITDNCAVGEAGSPVCPYQGREAQDASVLDRFWHLRMGYLSDADQLQMLRKKCRAAIGCVSEEIAHEVLQTAVRFAAMTRMNDPLHALGIAKDEGKPKYAYQLSRPACGISARSLTRFADILLRLIGARVSGGANAKAVAALADPVGTALSLAFAAGCEEKRRIELQQLAHFAFAEAVRNGALRSLS